MDVHFLTADADPMDGHGAFSAGTLAKGLRALGHKPVVVVPGSAHAESLSLPLARRLHKLTVELGDETIAVDIRSGKTTQGVELVVLGTPEQMGEGSASFAARDEAAARRFALFAKAAARFVAEAESEAVHGIGVAGALALAYLPSEDSTAVRVLSIDESIDVGRFDAATAPLFALGADARDADGVVALKAGILAADAIMAPSGSIGRALADDAAHPALARVVAENAGAFHSVLPGLDGATWNPLTDPHLPSRFDPVDRSGKARCASVLCKQLGLPVRAGAPFVVFELGTRDAAMDAAALEAVRAALRLDATVVVRTNHSGAALEALAERWTDRLVVDAESENARLHALLGAADLSVLAREDARSAGHVLASLRYGAVPLLSRFHPVANRLVDCEASLRTGNAFVADGLDAESLVSTLRRALAAFQTGLPFELVRQRAMRVDVSLERMARQAERLYRIARTESEIRVASA